MTYFSSLIPIVLSLPLRTFTIHPLVFYVTVYYLSLYHSHLIRFQSRLGPFPSVPYPGPDGTGRDEMGRECSDNQIITIIVQFFPAVTNDFLFHSPHVPVPLRHSPFVSRSVGSLMSFTSFPRPSGRDRRERNEGREEMEG